MQRETEGNAFFVEETLRALAEEAGALAQVGQLALPEQVLAGGVQEVLARRPRQRPTVTRPLLALAKACRALGLYAFFNRVGQPRAALWQGLYAWLQGQPAKAHQLWRKSLRAAETLQMPYEAALAHYEIGRHPCPTRPPPNNAPT